MYSRISNQMLIIVPMVTEIHLSKTFPPSCLPFAGMGYHGHIEKHRTAGCTGRPIQYIHTWQRYWSSPQTSERTNPQVHKCFDRCNVNTQLLSTSRWGAQNILGTCRKYYDNPDTITMLKQTEDFSTNKMIRYLQEIVLINKI